MYTVCPLTGGERGSGETGVTGRGHPADPPRLGRTPTVRCLRQQLPLSPSHRIALFFFFFPRAVQRELLSALLLEIALKSSPARGSRDTHSLTHSLTAFGAEAVRAARVLPHLSAPLRPRCHYGSRTVQAPMTVEQEAPGW